MKEIAIPEIKSNEEAIENIFKENGVVLAYLFGSRVRGTHNKMSDFDMALLFSEDTRIDEQERLKNKISNKLDKVLNGEMDVFNLRETNNVLLKFNVVFRGTVIYSKDDRTRFSEENIIMKESEDTEFLKQMQFYLMKRRLKENRFGL